jgi:hypothetical protein
MVQTRKCPSVDGTDGRQPVQLVDPQDPCKLPLLPLLTIYAVFRTPLTMFAGRLTGIEVCGFRCFDHCNIQ